MIEEQARIDLGADLLYAHPQVFLLCLCLSFPPNVARKGLSCTYMCYHA